MGGRGEKEDRCKFLRKRPREEGGHPSIYLTSRICPDDSVFFFELPLNSDLANVFVMNNHEPRKLVNPYKRTILAMFSSFKFLLILEDFFFFYSAAVLDSFY